MHALLTISDISTTEIGNAKRNSCHNENTNRANTQNSILKQNKALISKSKQAYI